MGVVDSIKQPVHYAPGPRFSGPEGVVHLEFGALAEIRVLGHDGLELVVSHVGLLRWNLLDLAEPVKDSGGFDLKNRALQGES